MADPAVPFELTPGPLAQGLWHSAASRLVATDPRETDDAARQLVASAADHGIDFGRAVASVLPGSPAHTRQVCLPVLGSGRTAMLFLSRPGQGGSLGPKQAQHAERVAVVREALHRLRGLPEASLAQGLSLPSERFAIEAYEHAGMQRIADLQYMSRPLPSRRGRIPGPSEVIDPPGDVRTAAQWPGGCRVVSAEGRIDRSAWEAAIEPTYEGTLDCPALRPMRRMADVVDSHLGTGEWTPGLWWRVELGGRPVGCVLLNPCPADDSVELVYLGLAPEARGRGLAGALLERGLELAGQTGLGTMRCAVDTKNTPARTLYERHGFSPIGSRVAHALDVSGPGR